jgi:hypothetical protein
MLSVMYAECHKLALILSVVMLNVVMLSAVILNVMVPLINPGLILLNRAGAHPSVVSSTHFCCKYWTRVE